MGIADYDAKYNELPTSMKSIPSGYEQSSTLLIAHSYLDAIHTKAYELKGLYFALGKDYTLKYK